MRECTFSYATPSEATYFEAIRIAWRLLWPAAASVGACVEAFVSISRFRSDSQSFVKLLIIAWGAIAISEFLTLPRVVSKDYRGFRIVLLSNQQPQCKIHLGLRWRVWIWLLLRQSAAAGASFILLAPANTLLWLFGVNAQVLLFVAVNVTVVNPLIIKLLIGFQFEACSLEISRRG